MKWYQKRRRSERSSLRIQHLLPELSRCGLSRHSSLPPHLPSLHHHLDSVRPCPLSHCGAPWYWVFLPSPFLHPSPSHLLYTLLLTVSLFSLPCCPPFPPHFCLCVSVEGGLLYFTFILLFAFVVCLFPFFIFGFLVYFCFLLLLFPFALCLTSFRVFLSIFVFVL